MPDRPIRWSKTQRNGKWRWQAYKLLTGGGLVLALLTLLYAIWSWWMSRPLNSVLTSTRMHPNHLLREPIVVRHALEPHVFLALTELTHTVASVVDDTRASSWHVQDYFWLPLSPGPPSSQPQPVVEAVARRYLQLLQLDPGLDEWLEGVEGVEWWVRRMNSQSTRSHILKPFHYDKDEASRSHHPLVSAVTYFAEHSASLVVTNITRSQCSLTGWEVQPEANLMAAFRGDLLHGVVCDSPGAESNKCSPSKSTTRYSLILNYWRSKPSHVSSPYKWQSGEMRNLVSAPIATVPRDDVTSDPPPTVQIKQARVFPIEPDSELFAWTLPIQSCSATNWFLNRWMFMTISALL